MIGQTILHFRIIEKLGDGGMGVVYKAEDTRLGRQVALKFLHEDMADNSHALERFKREAKAASVLNHPNICTIYDVGEMSGHYFIAMELLDGRSLKDVIQEGPLPQGQLLDLGIDISDALEAAHARGIIHRDIKPANIFVIKRGQAKVLDFGVAKLASIPGLADTTVSADRGDNPNHALTHPDDLVGTFAYMSPEQIRGEELDTRTDLFSLGAVLYEMATAQPAFAGKTVGVVVGAILNRNPVAASQVNPHVLSELEAIICKAFEKDPNLRYQHASELRADLQRLKRDSDSSREAGDVQLVDATNTAQASVAVSTTSKHSPLWRILVPVTVIVAVIALGTYAYFKKRPVMLTEKDTIVLADFNNKTGDSTFDDTMGQALSVSLRQSPYLNVLSDAKEEALLGMMAKRPEKQDAPKFILELCQRANSKAYIQGSIATIGSQYVIDLTAVNCATGDVLAQEQIVAKEKEEVLDALGKSASKLRAELGESLPSVQKFDAPLSQETTPSLAALKAFSLGLKTEREKGSLAALKFYERAVELDPNFVSAIESVGIGYSNRGQVDRANEYLTRAFQQRDRASEREKLHIAAMYYLIGKGDLDKAAEALQEWEKSYPLDDTPPGNLGLLYTETGQWQLAMEATQRSLQLDPDSVISYENLAQTFLALERYDDARKVLEDAKVRKLDDVGLHFNRYGLAFLQSDSKVMEEQVAWFADKPEFANMILALEQETQASTGHLQKARDLTRRAVDSAMRSDNTESAAIWALEGAYRDEIFGEKNTREQAVAAMKLAPQSSEAEEFAALVLAGSGDSNRAESLVRDLVKRFPSRTILRSYWLPTIRARIALAKKPQEAIQALEAAELVELGAPLSTQGPPCLYPVYVRGEAFLSARHGTEAAIEFQKLIDHPGITWGCATRSLSHVGLARAHALNGDRAKARAAYQDFLILWKDADPDIPILQQAKAEYANLQ
jgi:serine/threonine protein kinase/tetratricopeptide (TPR) repeat protein